MKPTKPSSKPAAKTSLSRAKPAPTGLLVTPKDLSKRTETRPTKQLDVFQNPQPARSYEIRFDCPEFTCLCPMTGQPDFATFTIRYVPDQLCVELKSLKLYLWSFRDEGHFHEDVTNRILDDLVAAIQPRSAEVVGDFLVRGGIRTVVTARHP